MYGNHTYELGTGNEINSMYCSDCIIIDKMKDGYTIQITVLLVQHLTFKAGGDIHESFV